MRGGIFCWPCPGAGGLGRRAELGLILRPVQRQQSPDASGLRAWLPELMDVLSAPSTLPAHLILPSPLPLRRLHRRARAAARIFPFFPGFAFFSVLLRFFVFFTSFLAFSSLFPVPAVLTVPCYFPPCLCYDWLAICVHQSRLTLPHHCHIWPPSLPTFLSASSPRPHVG